MKMKYSNISFYPNMKKIVFIILFLYIITFTSTKSTNQLNNYKQSRNLQYSIGSVYYELQYPLNDLTGTGDRLKDVPYKVKCKILACETGCCVGEIDKMSCGPQMDCAIYLDKLNNMTISIVVPVVIGFFVIFAILLFTFLKIYKIPLFTSICLSLGCLSIILIPWVIYFVYKKNKNVTSNEKNLKEE
jgi:hypothetical protein